MLTNEEKNEINFLVKQIKNNDENSLTILYTKMYKVIFRFLRKFCFDEEDIKDAISKTFIVILEKSKNKIFYKNCYSWILTIAKYQLKNHVRKFKKETSLESINLQITSPRTTEISEKLTIKTLIGKLPPVYQQLIFLKNEGFTNKQIAKNLKTSESTVNRKLDEIRKYLKDNLNDEG